MLVAIAPNKFAKGVESPADDWRTPANRRSPRAVYEVTALDRALSNPYTTDAHLVGYVMRDAAGALIERQPRVNKRGLKFVESLGYSLSVDVLLADVDNPAHCDWTPELLEEAVDQERYLATAGVYYTAHGRRIVQPLERAVPVSDIEGVIAGWLVELERLGFCVDWSCKDWTRHYKAPRANGLELRTFFDRMRPIDPPAAAAPRKGRVQTPATERDLDPTAPLAETPLAQAFEAAGWLGRSLGEGKRAARCPWRDAHTGGREFDSSTVLFASSKSFPNGYFHCSHSHCIGRTQDDAIAALPASSRKLIPPKTSPAPASSPTRELLDKPAARARLEDAFRRAGDGLSLVIAQCGLGKTQAAIEVAIERARHPGTKFTKTAISVPTHQLAAEIVARLRALGVSAQRLFGPLSHATDGKPTCIYHEGGSAFCSGGLSIPWHFCQGRGRQPCERLKTCAAANGIEGPEYAKIVVGPHALIGELDASAGVTGLLVIDEPPALLVHEQFTEAQLLAAGAAAGHYFEARYAAALRVALDALARHVRTGPLDEVFALELGLGAVDRDLLERAHDATGGTSAVEAVRAAFPPDPEDGPKRPKMPPVESYFVEISRTSKATAGEIGRASKILDLVYFALTSAPEMVKARIEERGIGGKRVRALVVTVGDLALGRALKREGSVVVADANGRYHLPLYEKLTGTKVPVTEAFVGDGATIERTVLRSRVTRKAWLPAGRFEATPAVVRVVRQVVDWLLEVPTAKSAIVTFEAVEKVLRDPKGPLAAELARLPSMPDLGHYGAVRGLDHWKGHDALVTLGDPWPQLSDVRWEAEFLSLSSWEARLEAWAAGELEQAHGRLRTVHRTSPARALHVGHVTPSGWQGHAVRRDAGGRRAVVDAAAVERAVTEHGGVKAAARALGVSPKTIRNHQEAT